MNKGVYKKIHISLYISICFQNLSKLPFFVLMASHYYSMSKRTSWSLLGLGVEVGLAPNCKKGIHIFPLLIFGSFFFFFLPSKLDVQCMVIAKKEQNKFLFQNSFELMFNKYNKQCKVGERHLNSYFSKKSKYYKVCNDYKINVCFNIVVGLRN
jgi:hypothetical protein